MDALTADRPNPRLTRNHILAHKLPGRTVFVLPGQGAQYPGMGRDLYEHNHVFADALDNICEALDAHLEVPLREVMFAEPGTAVGELVHQTAYTQPAVFAMGAAMHAVFVEAGITPDYLLGHSIGELTAAYIAGVFSLADAAVLVTARGRLMQACPPGEMLAIQASERDVVALLSDHPAIAIAAVNGPTSVVVSGHPVELEPIRDHCAAQGIRATLLVGQSRLPFVFDGPGFARVRGHRRRADYGFAHGADPVQPHGTTSDVRTAHVEPATGPDTCVSRSGFLTVLPGCWGRVSTSSWSSRARSWLSRSATH